MSTSTQKIDIAIVGGGILGLWSAVYLLKKYPGIELAVFEAANFLGEHTTGRNSEVLHSGIYYPFGSLKHIHCLRGNRLWRQFANEHQLPFLSCGKIIVASHDQLKQLDDLYQRAQKNEVQGIERLSNETIQELKSLLKLDAGFFVPSSGVLNVSESIKALESDIMNLGGYIVKNTKVSIESFSNDNFHLKANEETINCSRLLNTAGLFAIQLRSQLGLKSYTDYFVKGSYLSLNKRQPFKQLVYPIPPSDGLGLGVHLTLDTGGGQKFGPNTEPVSEIDYSMKPQTIDSIYPAIEQVFKSISKDDLSLGYSGIRPKIKLENKLVTDFVFNTPAELGIKGYFEFLGIESPGLTAAPSLAQLLCDKLEIA